MISGNWWDGIVVEGASGSGDIIQGNFIGTNATGTAALGNGRVGVEVFTSNNTVGGTVPGARNVISGNGLDGVRLQGTTTTANLIQGNFIGTNAAGTVAIGNGNHGVYVYSAAGNTIGGEAAGAGNVVSGNRCDGISIQGSTADDNIVQGNYIGTNAAGDAPIGNARMGVYLFEGASGNSIGGILPGAGNLISANGSSGVCIVDQQSTANTIQGNRIGTNAAGTVAIGNGNHGVYVYSAAGNRIGGEAAGAGNVVSGSRWDGISIQGPTADDNIIQGNCIGTNAAGDAPLGNGRMGVYLFEGASGNSIGGILPGAGNLISANGSSGVCIVNQQSTANTIEGNRIGTNAAGTVAIGNGNHGVYVYSAAGNRIGGEAAGAGNVVSGSRWDGISIQGPTADDNIIQGNCIGTNAAGDSPLGNGRMGVYVFDGASHNMIGGTTPGARNVISGCQSNGIQILGSTTTGNLIQGNFIGTNAAGGGSLGNQGAGVAVVNAPSNTIGGSAAGQGNRIAFNGAAGVAVMGVSEYVTISRNVIYGNLGLSIDLGNNGFTPNDPGDEDTGPNGVLNYPELCREPGAAAGSLRIVGQASHGATVELFQTNNLYGCGDARAYLGSITADAAGDFTYDVPVRQGGITTTATDTAGNTSEFSLIVPTCSGTVDAEYLLITNNALAASSSRWWIAVPLKAGPDNWSPWNGSPPTMMARVPTAAATCRPRSATASRTTTSITARSGSASAATKPSSRYGS